MTLHYYEKVCMLLYYILCLKSNNAGRSATKECLSTPNIIVAVAREIGSYQDLAHFTYLNRVVYHNGIGILWEEVHDVTQLAYLFPSLEIYRVGQHFKDANDVVVSYRRYYC